MRNILIILGGLAALLVVGVGLYQWLGGPDVPPPQAPTAEAPPVDEAALAGARRVTSEDYVIGAADAPVTVIEYASLTCPHCARFHEEVLPRLKEAYVESGRVRVVYRDFPLDGAALRAAMLARCAGRERYFAFIDLFFSRQQAWAAARDPVAELQRLARLGGMGQSEFAACLQNESLQREVLTQRLAAERAFGINATPSFVINGTPHIGGMTFEEIKAVIDEQLAAADGGK